MMHEISHCKSENIDRQTNRIDGRISLTVCVYLFIGLLNSAIKVSLGLSENAGDIISLVFMLIIAAFMLLSIGCVLQRALKAFIYGTLAIILLFVTSMLMGYSDESTLLNSFFNTYFICFLIAIHIYAINDREILYKMLLKASYPATVICVLSFVFLRNGTYSMGLAFNSIPFIMLQWNELIDRKRFWNLILACCSLLLVFFWGNRSALICCCIFILVKLIVKQNNLKNKALILLALFVIVALFMLFYNSIIISIQRTLIEYDKSSYIINSLVNDAFFTSNGRVAMASHYWSIIPQSPVWGYGVTGAFIGPGQYPHDIVTGSFLAFGYIGGFIILLIFFTSLCRVFNYRREEKSLSVLYLIWFSLSFALFASGNFLESIFFWGFMALAWPRKTNGGSQSKCI